jgi:hypothetical protein
MTLNPFSYKSPKPLFKNHNPKHIANTNWFHTSQRLLANEEKQYSFPHDKKISLPKKMVIYTGLIATITYCFLHYSARPTQSTNTLEYKVTKVQTTQLESSEPPKLNPQLKIQQLITPYKIPTYRSPKSQNISQDKPIEIRKAIVPN